MIASTSVEVDAWVAASAVVASSSVRMALVALDPPPDGFSAGGVATSVVMHSPGKTGVRDAAVLVRGLAASHDLVLVVASTGLLVPIGRGGWSLADLAARTRGGAVVVTGPGADPVNHTTLALAALGGLTVPTTVVVVGDLDEAALPVTPAGRIPGDRPDDPDRETAASWFTPALRATGAPGPEPRPEPSRGRRILLGLVAVFVVLVVLACGLGWVEHTTEARIAVTTVERNTPPRMAGPLPTRLQYSGPESEAVAEHHARALAHARARAQSLPVPSPDDCSRPVGRPALTPPDAATTARVDAAWRRIETWLARHAPASRADLRPPAATEAIEALQRQMAVAFPPDLVASLRRHDGAAEGGAGAILPRAYAPAGLQRILAQWGLSCRAAKPLPDRAYQPWSRHFVPFATTAAGSQLVVDQRPGGRGRVGETTGYGGTFFGQWPASVTELLEGTARALETGEPYLDGYRAYQRTGGSVDWLVTPLDVPTGR
ncbi:SMI1/KNR4 family protein [Jidongwangia harbinensis]|uniref:SMI1/KNR4 family protein n=1 Tax=Jidongwangia harbinensis TaxID=2878561 RepID=UPI001CD9730A|nr:SMI1/KNR4 family protein [Jidongwangia harbinensis]MCA2215712.1 SMI1/KNR4 family protein [Jidongwangia harbinensis]